MQPSPTSLVASVHSEALDSADAGAELGRNLAKTFGTVAPDAVVLFASARYQHERMIAALHDTIHPRILVGSSSAGEFIKGSFAEGSACAVGLRSENLRFSYGLGRGVAADRAKVAREIAAGFSAPDERFPYRAALVMTDALAGHGDELVEQLVLATDARLQFFGGGAGDDALFQRTCVFAGTQVFSDAAVGLEISSTKPIGIGVSHGWQPSGSPLRVTVADGARLMTLNAKPAVEAFLQHAQATGQVFDTANPMPFFLHNVIGIASPAGYRLRVPLAINADGSLQCASEVPVGALVSIMAPSEPSAARATGEALKQLDGNTPRMAWFFDCVATRLRMGKDFGFERAAVEELLGAGDYIGCNTYGQIARADGQFNGFHNCTAVVCVLPV